MRENDDKYGKCRKMQGNTENGSKTTEDIEGTTENAGDDSKNVEITVN